METVRPATYQQFKSVTTGGETVRLTLRTTIVCPGSYPMNEVTHEYTAEDARKLALWLLEGADQVEGTTVAATVHEVMTLLLAPKNQPTMPAPGLPQVTSPQTPSSIGRLTDPPMRFPLEDDDEDGLEEL